MFIVLSVFILSFLVFVKTLSYGLFEIKQNSNTLGGIITIVLAVISLVFPTLIILLNGFY